MSSVESFDHPRRTTQTSQYKGDSFRYDVRLIRIEARCRANRSPCWTKAFVGCRHVELERVTVLVVIIALLYQIHVPIYVDVGGDDDAAAV